MYLCFCKVKCCDIKIGFFNLLFLGLGASAMCFVTWNFAVKVLGAVKTSVYIYLVPVITVLCSVVVLHETISTRAALGILLTPVSYTHLTLPTILRV